MSNFLSIFFPAAAAILDFGSETAGETPVTNKDMLGRTFDSIESLNKSRPNRAKLGLTLRTAVSKL